MLPGARHAEAGVPAVIVNHIGHVLLSCLATTSSATPSSPPPADTQTPTSPCLLPPPQNSPGQRHPGDHSLDHCLANINN